MRKRSGFLQEMRNTVKLSAINWVCGVYLHSIDRNAVWIPGVCTSCSLLRYTDAAITLDCGILTADIGTKFFYIPNSFHI